MTWSLAQFNSRGGVLPIRSRTLGCEFLLAADDAAIDINELRPVYRMFEVIELLRLGPGAEDLRVIHKVKVVFDGAIVGGEEKR